MMKGMKKEEERLRTKVCILEDEKEELKRQNQECHTRQTILEDEKRKVVLEAERLRALLNPSAMTSECRAHRQFSAEKIQRAYRKMMFRKVAQQRQAEVVKKAQRLLLLKRIKALQRLWRSRQAHLRQLHEDFEKSRSATQHPSTKYDAILAFSSLSEFVSSGKIEMLQAVESHFNIASKESYRVVAVVGLFDKGKTFIINKLLGKDLPSGKLFTTKGLSFLWVKERRMLVLDSAGAQATVSLRTQAVQPILDAQTTESLLFEMISRIAHRMIFVVNDHTWVEQKYIAMLHQKYVQSQQSKELIVVHNLRTTGNILEARRLFKRQITSCYDGELSHLSELVYHADKGDGVPPVHHIGVCDEATAAGECFNESNLKLLMQMLEIGDTLGSNLVLSDLIRSELSRLLPKFVNIEGLDGGTGTAEGDEVAQQCTVNYVERSSSQHSTTTWHSIADDTSRSADIGDYQIAGTLEMHTQCPGCRVVMKTRGVISSLGEVIAHDVSFDPIFNVFDNQDHTLRYIKVDCPSVTDDDYELFDKPNGVKIVIQKPKAIDESQIKAIYPIRQHHGTWEREFIFDKDEGRFEYNDDDQPESSLEHGVLTVVLRRTVHARKLNKRRSKHARKLGDDQSSIHTEDSYSICGASVVDSPRAATPMFHSVDAL